MGSLPRSKLPVNSKKKYDFGSVEYRLRRRRRLPLMSAPAEETSSAAESPQTIRPHRALSVSSLPAW